MLSKVRDFFFEKGVNQLILKNVHQVCVVCKYVLLSQSDGI